MENHPTDQGHSKQEMPSLHDVLEAQENAEYGPYVNKMMRSSLNGTE